MTATNQSWVGKDGTVCLVMTKLDMDKALARLRLETRHLAPIYTAIRDEGLVHLILTRGKKVGPTLRRLRRKPTVVTVGDDMETAMGPNAFHRKSLRRIFQGASFIILHCAKPAVEHYALAVDKALTHGRAVIIESQPDCEVEWMAFLFRHALSIKTMVITPNCANYSCEGGWA